MKSIRRLCWWCGNKLSATSHAEVGTPDGFFVWVHKVCENATRAGFRKVTAQPREIPATRGHE